jgi:predicted nucleic acid-binding protein
MTVGIADRFVVVLDANVLFPFRLRDALLRFAEQGLFRARWSGDILEEWKSRLLAMKPHLRESLESQLKAMETAFPESLVSGYDHLINSLKLPDANDRHVLAAAIVCGAQHIVTENLKDFPSEALDPFGIEAISADTFLAGAFELYPAEAMTALRTMRRAYRNPPMNPSEFLLDLIGSGLVNTASLAKAEIDFL